MTKPFTFAPAYAQALRRIGGFLFWIGIVLAVFGLLMAVGSYDNPQTWRVLGGVVASLGVGMVLFGFGLRVAGELLGVLFAIEENTRKALQALSDVSQGLAALKSH